jgi:predicted  nucleic acid-binding Zn-ribbon protein
MSTEAKQELTRKIDSLQRDLRSLHEDVRMARHRDRIEDLGSTIHGLPQRVQELRNRGYPFEKALESGARELRQRWPAQAQKVLQQIEAEFPRLARDLQPVESQVRQVAAAAGDPARAQRLLETAERAVEAFEGKVKAVSSTIDGMYDQIEHQVSELESRLHHLDEMLDRFAEATFRLLPSEAGIGAVSARWDKGGDDDPVGVLYVTDQRLLFEQKQEIATKKVLFITTEKELLHKLLLEAPLGQIKGVQASKRGLLRHEDHIDVQFEADAAVSAAHFHLDGQDCMEWQGLIGRAQGGGFDQDRAVEIDQELVERARSAPTRCPVCNAPLTQRIVRGMDRITCEYCGHLIRL